MLAAGGLTAVQLSLLLLGCVVRDVMSCSPGRGSGQRRGRGRMTPLVYKQHVPNVPENTLGASGPAEASISRSDRERFDDLVVNNNPDIVFKNRRGNDNDRIMSQRCREKVNMLSVLVMNQWPGVRLRVTEAWLDPDTDPPAVTDSSQSLHYEGRAVDLTTSDRDRSKYGLLARLAVNVGFDWVYYESRAHVHCSVKSDSSMAAGAGGGCFPGHATVSLSSGQTQTMNNLTLGDRVLTYDESTQRFHYEPVIAFLHRSPTQTTQYVTVLTEYGQRLTLTPGHLIYVGVDSVKSPSHWQPVFAGHLRTGTSYVIVVNNASMAAGARVVRMLDESRGRSRGLYAPITGRGTLVVDDIVVSCYAEFASHATAHASLAPLRYLHYVTDWVTGWMIQTSSSALESSERSYISYPDLNSDDGVHWYAAVLRRLAKPLLPAQFWWSDA